MKNSGTFTQKWNDFLAKIKNYFAKEKPAKMQTEAVQTSPVRTVQEEDVPSKAKRILSVVWKFIFALRKVLLALPVVYCALKMAAYNRENLPVLVGIDLQSTGEFAQMISRDTAVNVPLLITFACLGLMVFSRKTIYPWLISIFTLVLPVLLYLTNGYLG